MNDPTTLFITAVLTMLGWFATYAFAKKLEDRTRRLDLLMKFRTQQIEGLYGPLLSLIEQIFSVWRVREAVLNGTQYSEDDRRQISNYFWDEHFHPLHLEIGALLRTKLYLLENGRLPASFTKYLEHSTQEACQRMLGSKGVDTSKVPRHDWPDDFSTDVKKALHRLMAEYQSGLAKLG